MKRALLIACATLAVAPAAHAQCGYGYRPPAGARVGAAPFAVGDSVMLGAIHELSQAGFEVDARCARNTREGLDVMRQKLRRGRLPEIVVFALGTNIAVGSRDIARALHLIGPRRTLMLVTPFRSGHPFNTGPMRRAARRKPHRVKLIDWSSRAQRHGEWIVGDGTHLTPSGRVAYTRLLKRAAWSRQRGRFGRR